MVGRRNRRFCQGMAGDPKLVRADGCAGRLRQNSVPGTLFAQSAASGPQHRHSTNQTIQPLQQGSLAIAAFSIF